MSVEEVVEVLCSCIKDEFVAVSEVRGNSIYMRFLSGELIKIEVSE